MTEFVPGWVVAITMVYVGVATLALLVTIVWRLRITEEAAGLSPSGFADAFRDREIVAVCVLLGVGAVAGVAGLNWLAEVAAVVGSLLVGAQAQLETVRAVAYYPGPRGETA
jgi:hypothetical protein